MGVEGADGEAGEGVAREHASSGQHRMMTNTGVTLVPFQALYTLTCTHTHKRAYAHSGARTCPYRVTTQPRFGHRTKVQRLFRQGPAQAPVMRVPQDWVPSLGSVHSAYAGKDVHNLLTCTTLRTVMFLQGLSSAQTSH